jgi:hypothetical protein
MTKIPFEEEQYMLLELGYERQLLFPMDKAIEFLRIYSEAIIWDEPYGKTARLKTGVPPVNIKFKRRAELAQMQFNEVLGLSEEDDE